MSNTKADDTNIHAVSPLSIAAIGPTVHLIHEHVWVSESTRVPTCRLPIVRLQVLQVEYLLTDWRATFSQSKKREVPLKRCVTSQSVYPLSEQDALEAQERRYTAYGKERHWEQLEDWVRGQVQRLIQELLEEEMTGVSGKGEVGPQV